MEEWLNKDGLIALLEETDSRYEFAETFAEDRYYNYTLQDRVEDIYGSAVDARGLINRYLDRDAAVDWLVEVEDESYLREMFDN